MKNTHTRATSLRTLTVLLTVVLLGLCVFAVVGDDLLTARPEPGTAEETVWLYAKEHGHSLGDYPQSLIDLLKRNPEAKQFVLEYPDAKDASPVIDMTPYLEQNTVPLFLQWDPRWGYIIYGSDVAGLTGCGPVCLSMAALYVTGDPAYSPDSMIRFATEQNYYVPGSGSSWTLISEGAGKLGLKATELPLVKKKMTDALEAGHPVILAVGAGDFTTTGHYIVLTGLEDGMFRVNAPNSVLNSGRLWSYEQLEGQIRNIWEISL